MGVYGPQLPVKCLFKTLFFTHVKRTALSLTVSQQ